MDKRNLMLLFILLCFGCASLSSPNETEETSAVTQPKEILTAKEKISQKPKVQKSELSKERELSKEKKEHPNIQLSHPPMQKMPPQKILTQKIPKLLTMPSSLPLPISSSKNSPENSSQNSSKNSSKNKGPSVPIIINAQVQSLINFYTKNPKGRIHFQKTLMRAREYQQLMEDILTKAGYQKSCFIWHL